MNDIRELADKFEQHNKALLAEIERVGGETKQFKQRSDEICGRLTEVEQLLAASHRGGNGRGGADETWGEQVACSNDLAEFVKSYRRNSKVAIKVKTITTIGTSAGALITPDRRGDPVMLPQQRQFLRDLIMPGETNSNSIEYPRQTVRTNNAAVVTEGAEKPESNIEFELKTVPVRTIAHWVRASKQALDDAPLLRGLIDGELRYGLRLEEEDEMLNGDGTGVHILGIIPQATTYDRPVDFPQPDSPNDADKLLAALAQSVQALLPATGIVLNDLKLMSFQQLKDGEGRYLFGGPGAPPLRSLWGVPCVGTPQLAYDEFLVGAFRDGAQVLDRMEAEVLVSTEDGDNFRKNLVTVLAEERLALAVKRPQAFIHGDFTVAT